MSIDISYDVTQQAKERANIEAMTDYELKEFIKTTTYPGYKRIAQEVLRARDKKDKLFTTFQAKIIVISTVVMAACAVAAVLIQILEYMK